MLQITKNITLGTTDSSIPKCIEVKKGDIHTRFVNIKFVDDKDVFVIPENTNARIICIKPDGKYVYNDAQISENTVTVELTDQMLSVEGKAKCEIELYNDGALLTSAEFLIDVQHTLRDDRKLESADEYGAFVNALSEVEYLKDISQTLISTSQEYAFSALEYKNSAQLSATSALESADNASGFASSAQASATNAQAYSQNADSFAANAEISATNALNAQLLAQGHASQAAQSAQIVAHPPRINNSYNWEVWDTQTNAYVDSGIEAKGMDGVSITNATINPNGHLMETLSNGTAIDCGLVSSDISGKENTANKVTTLSASSTDTQYPSAKCVYDLIGDVNTAITAINTIIGGNE